MPEGKRLFDEAGECAAQVRFCRYRVSLLTGGLGYRGIRGAEG